MTDEALTTEHVRQTFAYVQAGLDDDDGYPFVMHVHVEAFDAWLASVERAAAEKAMPIVREWLLEAKAEALEEFAERWATADGIEVLMFATDDVSAVQLTEKAMLARATDYRREEA